MARARFTMPHPAIVTSGPQLLSVIAELEAGTYPQPEDAIWRGDLPADLAVRLAKATGATDEQIADMMTSGPGTCGYSHAWGACPVGQSDTDCHPREIPADFTPVYEPWRHGGWYVTNVRRPSGAVGCVSRNYEDRKWRIVCDPRPGSFPGGPDDHTYPNRDAAARAELALALAAQANAHEYTATEPGGYCTECGQRSLAIEHT